MSCRWTYCFMRTRNTELYYQFIQEIINTSKLTIFEAIFRWNVWRRLSAAIHNSMRVMEQHNRLRHSWFSIWSSAHSDLLSGKPWSARSDAAEAYSYTDDFLHFFFLIKNTVTISVNNECSQWIQSVRHSKRTRCMWPHRKDRSTQKKKTKSVSHA